MKNEELYTQFALVREMMETPEILRNFKLKNADAVIDAIKIAKKVFFTGEGSSRIFPAKNAIYSAMRAGLNDGNLPGHDRCDRHCRHDLFCRPK